MPRKSESSPNGQFFAKVRRRPRGPLGPPCPPPLSGGVSCDVDQVLLFSCLIWKVGNVHCRGRFADGRHSHAFESWSFFARSPRPPPKSTCLSSSKSSARPRQLRIRASHLQAALARAVRRGATLPPLRFAPFFSLCPLFLFKFALFVALPPNALPPNALPPNTLPFAASPLRRSPRAPWVPFP